MFGNFMMKQLLRSKMKGVPQDQQEKVMKAIEENPEIFTKIASEIQEKMSQGKDQMTAIMEIAPKYEADLKKLIG